MPATHDAQSNTTSVPTLYLAFELGWTTWKLALATAPAQNPRLVTIPARDLEALEREIAKARRRFGLADRTPLCSVYEAGRDGFWLHRYLLSRGYDNLVVDAASIEVNRRARRAKSDGLDVVKLLAMLQRHHGGERDLWGLVHVPSVAVEDQRQPQRELMALKRERTEHSNRIKGLLAHLGLAITVDAQLPERLEGLRQWDGQPVPAELRGRLLREFARWQLVDGQVHELENRQRRRVRDEAEVAVDQVRRLMDLKGVGPVASWLLVQELFSWRQIKNRCELASLVGLTPTPYQSGSSHREQGISKAGNRRVRWLMVELAWMWLTHQPGSALSQWYQQRFGAGNARARKVGIVALARKLLVALWKYLQTGVVPEGAETVPWIKKLNGRLPAGAG